MRVGVFGGSLTVALLLAPSARADNLAYVRASSQYGWPDMATYHPVNLLDDDPATLWCESDPDLGEGQIVRIIFKRPQRIDRIVVDPAPGSGRLVEAVRVSDGNNSVLLEVRSGTVEQPVTPAMRGTVYTVSIERVGGPNKDSKLGNDVACLANVMLYLGRQAFGGNTKPADLRYDKQRDQILGDWNGEPFGAPEKFFTFALDGTWAWRFAPLMSGGGGKRALSGEYRFRGGRLLMRKGDSGRWADMNLKTKTIKIDPDAPGAAKRDYRAFVLNNALGGDLAGEYNDAEF